MKILIFGDIYGRLWRKGFLKEISVLRDKYKPDFTIANIENITSWRWPVSQHAELIEKAWVDLMTSGDHIYDNLENITDYLEKEDAILIRPANFYESDSFSLPGNGSKIIEKNKKKLWVIQLLWEAFMSHKVYNPFLYVEKILSSWEKEKLDGILVEFHRETTAELYGMAHFLKWRVATVYGTHTHIQTNDAHILEGGLGMISDIGMNGPFDSVIWADFASVKKRFLSGMQKGKIDQQLKWKYIINAIFLEVEKNKTTHIENISYTWKL